MKKQTKTAVITIDNRPIALDDIAAVARDQRPPRDLVRVQQVPRIRCILPRWIEVVDGHVPMTAILHVPTGREAEAAVTTAETATKRSAVLVPLADMIGVVSPCLECPCNAVLLESKLVDVWRGNEYARLVPADIVCQREARGILPRHDARPGRGTDRTRGVSIGKLHAVAS